MSKHTGRLQVWRTGRRIELWFGRRYVAFEWTQR